MGYRALSRIDHVRSLKVERLIVLHVSQEHIVLSEGNVCYRRLLFCFLSEMLASVHIKHRSFPFRPYLGVDPRFASFLSGLIWGVTSLSHSTKMLFID